MPLAPCARCKKLFSKSSTPVCADCQADEEADYRKVLDLLDAHPDLDTEAVAERAEVDVAVVKRMLDKGIIAVMTGRQEVKCGRCGAPAISMAKKLCEACLQKLNAEMMQAQTAIRLGEKKSTRITGFNVRETYEDKRR